MNSKLLSFTLCALFATSSISANATSTAPELVSNNRIVCAGILATAVYYALKAAPDRDADLSLKAFKQNPLAWLEDALGNRSISPVVDSLDANNKPIWDKGQKGRGFLGLFGKWEDVALVIGVFATITEGKELIDGCLGHFTRAA